MMDVITYYLSVLGLNLIQASDSGPKCLLRIFARLWTVLQRDRTVCKYLISFDEGRLQRLVHKQSKPHRNKHIFI